MIADPGGFLYSGNLSDLLRMISKSDWYCQHMTPVLEGFLSICSPTAVHYVLKKEAYVSKHIQDQGLQHFDNPVLFLTSICVA